MNNKLNNMLNKFMEESNATTKEEMNKILDINPVNLTAKVQPGVILGDFKKTVEDLNLFFPSFVSGKIFIIVLLKLLYPYFLTAL